MNTQAQAVAPRLAPPAHVEVLASILEGLPDAILLLDREWRITYANRLARQVSRISEENLNRETLWELYPEIVGTDLERAYREAVELRVDRRVACFYYEPFGTWFDVTILPTMEGVTVHYRDVTSERVAQAERDASAQQLRDQYLEIDGQRREMEAIYRGTPIGMALYEPNELRLLRLNDRQAEILGLAPEEAIGKRFEELVPDVVRSRELLRRAAAGEPMLNHSVEGTLPSRPHDYRYWNVNYSPIFGENGEVKAVAGATIETTQQRLAEKALMQNEKLAAVGRLASSIAHEINNPLEAVTNLLYISRQTTELDTVQSYLEIADEELRRVANIVNQTLRFHKQASRPHAVSCLDLFTTVLNMYQSRLRNSKIVVERRKRAQQPVEIYEGDIRQVLNNVVGNSIDAMPHGGRLLVRSREATDWRTGRRGLVLTLADTGCGIDPTVQARVFEPFFTTKETSGTGLGLWISAEIMERHGGWIHLRSSQRPGRSGTVVALFLPFEGFKSSVSVPTPVAEPMVAG